MATVSRSESDLRWTETVLSKRVHDHVLVIPVINEGDRIRKQLLRIAALAPPVDIVIADGGSTDGSVEPDFLAASGVRALLTKTSGGRLSAQLRMAYRWALEEGYRGIVTMDGNGKDGVDAILRFVAALDHGFDYVQGSRYLPGGQAINTPFDRWLAGRFVHAPLLSLGAGRWLTDTTNGFRAYSARYLMDPRTAPFRDVFQNYALLFYLTVRAARIGYRVTEIPVTRAYPAGEATPTKITGFGSKVSLLREAALAVVGGFNPLAAERRAS
jgi:dolichol-phosphate mannosyltransferase